MEFDHFDIEDKKFLKNLIALKKQHIAKLELKNTPENKISEQKKELKLLKKELKNFAI